MATANEEYAYFGVTSTKHCNEVEKKKCEQQTKKNEANS